MKAYKNIELMTFDGHILYHSDSFIKVTKAWIYVKGIESVYERYYSAKTIREILCTERIATNYNVPNEKGIDENER